MVEYKGFRGIIAFLLILVLVLVILFTVLNILILLIPVAIVIIIVSWLLSKLWKRRQKPIVRVFIKKF